MREEGLKDVCDKSFAQDADELETNAQNEQGHERPPHGVNGGVAEFFAKRRVTVPDCLNILDNITDDMPSFFFREFHLARPGILYPVP